MSVYNATPPRRIDRLRSNFQEMFFMIRASDTPTFVLIRQRSRSQERSKGQNNILTLGILWRALEIILTADVCIRRQHQSDSDTASSVDPDGSCLMQTGPCE